MNYYLPQPHKPPQKMKAHVYGLAAVRTLEMFSQRLCPLVILIHLNGLTTEMWLNKIQHRLYRQSSIWSTSHCNLPGLTSLVDSVTQCCVVLQILDIERYRYESA